MTSQFGLRADELACRRDDRLLFDALGFHAEKGQMLEICGKNGSGKTTLLRLLCGLRQPDEGQIFWRGQNILDDPENYRQTLCYVGHLSGLKADLSPYDNLCAESQLFGVSQDAVEPALQSLGLGREIDIPCHRLSAGQLQRASLARLLVRGADLWILDEPCASLDRDAQLNVQTILENHALAGGTVVFTTHQPIEFKRADVRQLWLSKSPGDAVDA